MARIGLPLLLLAFALASVCTGAVAIAPADFAAMVLRWLGFAHAAPAEGVEAVLLHVRIPRLVLAAAVGSTLAVCGAALQGMFRNPLADPALIGVSGGAAVAVVAVTLLGRAYVPSTLLGPALPSVAGFLGALATVTIVHRFSLRSGRMAITAMLLAGIGINALAGALTSLMIHFANDAQVRSILFWSMGSLAGASWKMLAVALPIMAASVAALFPLARSLDAMMLGETEAGYLGIDVEQTKRGILQAVSLGVAISVAVGGIIGFVALVAPHIMRLLCGADHRRVLVGSVWVGAILLTAADMGARTLAAPAELPIGALTALVGSPMLLWLLRSRETA